MAQLDQPFFAKSTIVVARDLIGCLLVSDRAQARTSGRIVEVEAYCGPGDPASHASFLRGDQVKLMWGPPGFAYVYRSYGIHTMLNVVTETDGVAGAVLLRAVEPVEGIEAMRLRRRQVKVELLCSGPGRLCQALGVTLNDHGLDLVRSDELWIERGHRSRPIVASERIGISRGRELPWRFFESDNRYVSSHRRGVVTDD